MSVCWAASGSDPISSDLKALPAREECAFQAIVITQSPPHDHPDRRIVITRVAIVITWIAGS